MSAQGELMGGCGAPVSHSVNVLEYRAQLPAHMQRRDVWKPDHHGMEHMKAFSLV